MELTAPADSVTSCQFMNRILTNLKRAAAMPKTQWLHVAAKRAAFGSGMVNS